MTDKAVEVVLPFAPEDFRCLQSFMELAGIDDMGEFVIAALNFDLECQKLPLIDIKECSFDFGERVAVNRAQERISVPALKITMIGDACDIMHHMFETNGDAWVGAAMDFYVSILEYKPSGRIKSSLLRRHFN